VADLFRIAQTPSAAMQFTRNAKWNQSMTLEEPAGAAKTGRSEPHTVRAKAS